MNNWKNIWNQDNGKIEYAILEMLIKLDGYYERGITTKTFLDYANLLIQKLNIKNNSIFEVGCGCGAMLYTLKVLLQKHNHNIKGGGVDYSKSYINLIQKLFDSNFKFVEGEAINLDTNTKMDFVISNSVFHYFTNLDYAEKVVEKMLQKANIAVGIFDINDESKQNAYEIKRQQEYGEIYITQFENLPHLFYHKNWFENIAKQHNWQIEIFDQNIENYVNSPFRFNVIFKK